MDPYVIDLPWWKRFLIVHLFVLPKRPRQTARAYQSIWRRDGSPLVFWTSELTAKLQKRLDCPVRFSMRYGEPSIKTTLRSMAETLPSLRNLVVFPLYPQYADSTVRTAVEKVKIIASKYLPSTKLLFSSPFYSDAGYVSALVESAKPFLKKPFDKILFTYHGLPERHIRRLDTTGSHCLVKPDCCSPPGPGHHTCYRFQSFEITRRFCKQADIPPEKSVTSFQSRFGNDPWIQPYTEDVLQKLPGEGVRDLLVLCPSFVSDCLETLEEIGIRGKETFLSAGGSSFTLIPCLNDTPRWVDFCAETASRLLGNNRAASPSSTPL